MDDTIRVHVVKYPDRENLVMRYVDPFTGRQVQRSTKTTNKRDADKAAGKWEAELREGRYKAHADDLGRVHRQLQRRKAIVVSRSDGRSGLQLIQPRYADNQPAAARRVDDIPVGRLPANAAPGRDARDNDCHTPTAIESGAKLGRSPRLPAHDARYRNATTGKGCYASHARPCGHRRRARPNDCQGTRQA